MAKKRKTRLYYREGRGWYADLRDHSEVGGRREALKAPGPRFTTQDQDEAISPYTLMRELGHSSLGLIERTYGHLLHVRDRSARLEFREAQVVSMEERRRA